ncbi:unnamed protein product [Dovyalis caffra]|uniref:Protein E6 n=1 Tax=Dovyalis caffra TaxID=77055 RepID=A0AAV1SHQ5_9ROSI|nr:unnamed protein product [Dovyalis caffra]
MAISPRLISILFLLTISSMQIHAREGQFFSKVSATTTTPSTTTINSNNNAQDKTLPNKGEEGLNKQELDPAFMPDTQNGYGLYGQESTQFPTTTKLANTPYTTTTHQPYKTQTQTQTQETYTNYPTYSTPNTNTKYYSNNQYSNNAYEEHQQNFGETSLQEREYSNMGNQNNNKYYNGANGYNNEEKQGMSDTRYLANGRFYYDPNNGNSNHNPNQYQQNSRNNYNTRGYYNNNNNNNNNENSNYEYNNNSMQKYDNQDDFEWSQEEQYVP